MAASVQNQSAIREALIFFSRLPSWTWRRLQAMPPLQTSLSLRDYQYNRYRLGQGEEISIWVSSDLAKSSFNDNIFLR